MYEEIYNQASEITEELIEKAKLTEGQILVVGCSSSEVGGSVIGTDSNVDIAKAVFSGINDTAKKHGIYVAAQCCEHLNRAIIIERDAVPGMDVVNVVPQPKAGGSFATNAYNLFENPVAIEKVRADAGLDIGDTFIGMHLKEVAVPVRLSKKCLGEAHVTAARVRPKFIGGCRACYDEKLM